MRSRAAATAHRDPHRGADGRGVLGTHKIAYDVWGDTLNTAKRMESYGLPATSRPPPRTRQALGDASASSPARFRTSRARVDANLFALSQELIAARGSFQVAAIRKPGCEKLLDRGTPAEPQRVRGKSRWESPAPATGGAQSNRGHRHRCHRLHRAARRLVGLPPVRPQASARAGRARMSRAARQDEDSADA